MEIFAFGYLILGFFTWSHVLSLILLKVELSAWSGE